MVGKLSDSFLSKLFFKLLVGLIQSTSQTLLGFVRQGGDGGGELKHGRIRLCICYGGRTLSVHFCFYLSSIEAHRSKVLLGALTFCSY